MSAPPPVSHASHQSSPRHKSSPGAVGSTVGAVHKNSGDNYFGYLQKQFTDGWTKATAPFLRDISLEYTPPCDSDPKDAISLVINGLSDSNNEDVRLSLIRAPGGNSWIYSGSVPLPTEPSSLTVVVTSHSLGDLGVVFIPKEEMVNGHATKTMDGDTSNAKEISISYLVTADVQVTKADELVLDGMPLIQEDMEHFNNTRDSEHLDRAITSLQKLSSVVGGCATEAHVLTCLSYALFVRFQVLGPIEDIDSSIGVQERVTKLSTKPVDTGYAILRLGMLFSYRAESSWEEKDDIKALSVMDPALDTPVAVVIANSYCFDSVLRRCERSLHRPEELLFDRAVTAQRLASIDAAVTKNPSSSVRCRLGRALCARFKRTNKLKDLETASGTLKSGIDAARSGNPHLIEMLTLLGSALELRWKHAGDLDHLTSAIYAYERAVELTPSPHWYRPHALHNFGSAMLNLYKHTEDTKAIQKAVELLELAAKEILPAHALFAKIRASLTSSLVLAHQDTDDGEYLRKASSMTSWVPLLPLPSTVIPSIGFLLLFQMADSFIEIYTTSHDAKQIDSAIRLYRQTKDIEDVYTPQPGFLIARNLSLAKAIVLRYRVGVGDASDLNEAIAILQEIYRDLPEGHTMHGAVMGALGSALMLASKHKERKKSVVLHLLSTAASLATSPPEHRLEAALDLGLILRKTHGATASLDAYDMAMEHLAAIGSSSGTIKARQRLLSKNSHAITLAAEVAFAADRVDKALTWFEQGRGIVWNQLNALRTPLDGLRDANPTVAQRLHEVSQKLEAGSYGGLMEDVSDLHAQANTRLKLSKERDELLTTIRTTIPGYENFLRPPSPMLYLEHLPKSGPVIVISSHPKRCDAIALLSGIDTPLHIPLPECSSGILFGLQVLLSGTLETNNLRMRGDGGGDRKGRESKITPPICDPEPLTPIERVLKQLWLILVKPIVDALALSFTPGVTPTTRIWWCLTGMASFSLPVHAAGIYRGKDAVSMLDYAVSSYIPTVSVLSDRLKATLIPRASSGSKALLVSVPGAPGPFCIPETTVEVNDVKKILEKSSISTIPLQGSAATVESVSEALQECTSIHLACHASQEIRQPLRSGFRLYDGQLDLATIIKLKPKHTDFAFLSACQTSTGSPNHSEEAIHLAAGLLAAGYRGVVATMWSISDLYAPKLAEDFYENLVVRGGNIEGMLDVSHAAYSLHHAVNQLRASLGTSEQGLLVWVPYVHYGL